jgi:hypothetical protein
VTRRALDAPRFAAATTTAMAKVLFDFIDPNAANAWLAIDDP